MASIKLTGDTSGEITISAPAVAGTNTLTLPAQTGTVPISNVEFVTQRKTATPLIINGDMQVAQRGTSVTGLTSTAYSTVDRFETVISGAGTWTESQSTDVPTGQGFFNSLKKDCTTANGSLASSSVKVVTYSFEGQDLQVLKKGTSSAESITVSFWVKSAKTGTYILELFDYDNTRQISQAYTISSANTWEKKVLSFAGDTTGTLDNDNGQSFALFFWLAGGSNFTSGTLNTSWASSTSANRAVGQVNLADSTSNDWYITGIQMEVGTFDANSIPPFQFEDVGTSLARCQRYYYKQQANGTSNYFTDVGFAISTTTAFVYSQFPVTMRANPTALEQSGTATHYQCTRFGHPASQTCSAVPSFQDASLNHAVSIFTVSSGLQSGYAGGGRSASANAYLAWSAEL